MNLPETVKQCLNLYYFVGISSYSPIANQLTKPQLILAQFSRYLQLLVSVCLPTFIMVRLNYPDVMQSFRQMETLLLIIYVSFDIKRGLCVLVECLFYYRGINDIFMHFRSIELRLATELNHRIEYQPLMQTHNRKMLIIFSGFLLFMVVFITRLIASSMSPIGVPLSFLQFIQAITLLHVIFYIDIQCFHLAELNKVVRRDTTLFLDKYCRVYQTADIRSIVDKLKCYKAIHFQLWEVSMLHNKVFGWGTIALLLHICIALVHSAFWLWNELKTESGLIKACRKLEKYFPKPHTHTSID